MRRSLIGRRSVTRLSLGGRRVVMNSGCTSTTGLYGARPNHLTGEPATWRIVYLLRSAMAPPVVTFDSGMRSLWIST